MPTPVKVNHIIHLRGDDYQKIRIIKMTKFTMKEKFAMKTVQ